MDRYMATGLLLARKRGDRLQGGGGGGGYLGIWGWREREREREREKERAVRLQSSVFQKWVSRRLGVLRRECFGNGVTVEV